MDIEDTIKLLNEVPTDKITNYVDLTRDLLETEFDTHHDMLLNIKKLTKIYHISPSVTQIRMIYHKYLSEMNVPQEKLNLLVKCSVRSQSGVLVNTVTTSPGPFSCPKNCHYCPNEVDDKGIATQPRSYLSREPAMRRASRHNFNIVSQIQDRIDSYFIQGNAGDFVENRPIIKQEVIVSGGTWSYYPDWYQLMVMRDIYYASNTYSMLNPRLPYFYDDTLLNQVNVDYSKTKQSNINIKNVSDVTIEQLKLSLEQEMKENETTMCRVIGITIETRPDWIQRTEIKKLLSYGVTRVQIGVQTIHDEILKLVNRECYLVDTIRAIKMLKESGLKVVVHLMPDLPGSSPKLDRQTFDFVLYNPDLYFDDIKIYPTALVEHTKIIEWYENKEYIPYAETNIEDLISVIRYYLERVPKYVRVQRVIRDIPSDYLKDDVTDKYRGYGKQTNLREIIEKRMADNNKRSQDIRSMEVRNKTHLLEFAELTVYPYDASGGKEYFISFETCQCRIKNSKCVGRRDTNNFCQIGDKSFFKGCPERVALFGFCRLRLSRNMGCDAYNKPYIEEVHGHAMVRELHVYGTSANVGKKGESQHNGFGRMLMTTAEEIALVNNYKKISVIAGVGVREYYKNKLNYELGKVYMTKLLIDSDDIIIRSSVQPKVGYMDVLSGLVNYTWNKMYVYSWKTKQYFKSRGWI